MEDPISERCLLIKSIEEECHDSFISLEKLYDIIQIQDNRIKKLEAEIKFKDDINKKVLFENAQYSIDSLKILLNIIWPLTKKKDFQQTLINNDKFIDLLFENLQSSSFLDLIFPILGILSNLNSNIIFRSKYGFISVLSILEKDHLKIIENLECFQVFLYLLYNVSFDTNVINELIEKSPLLEFMKEVSLKAFRIPEHYDLFYQLLMQMTNLLIQNASTEMISNDSYLIQIRDICMSIKSDKNGETSKIVRIINEFFSSN